MSDPSLNNKKIIQEKQPKALYWLFMTELWERFSYWSLYSLLVLYFVHSLHMHDKYAYMVFAAFNALLYASPIVGGWLADKYIGVRNAIIQGAIWLSIGYVMLAVVHTHLLIYISMGLLIWGNGLLKPNISTQLGNCYHDDDSRRQRGFTIYYMGINIGAVIGVLLCGAIANHYGWMPAILIVAGAMIIALITYLSGQKSISKDILTSAQSKNTLQVNMAALLTGLVVIVPLGLLLSNVHAANIALYSVLVLLAMYLLMIVIKQKGQAKKRMIVCLILTTASVVFWALYSLMGSSLTLYTQRFINLSIGGYTLGASMVSSLNGIWLLVLSPILVKLWYWLNKKGIEPKTDVKFVLGILMMALGYLVLAISAMNLAPGVKGNLSWVLSSYGLQTLGELCLSPIGLAMVTELAPKNYKSLMMGVWFLSNAVASALSGLLAGVAAVPKHIAAGSEASIYAHSFMVNSIIGFIAAVILISIIPMIRKLMR